MQLAYISYLNWEYFSLSINKHAFVYSHVDTSITIWLQNQFKVDLEQLITAINLTIINHDEMF